MVSHLRTVSFAPNLPTTAAYDVLDVRGPEYAWLISASQELTDRGRGLLRHAMTSNELETRIDVASPSDASAFRDNNIMGELRRFAIDLQGTAKSLSNLKVDLDSFLRKYVPNLRDQRPAHDLRSYPFQCQIRSIQFRSSS